jgi:hypothetical protein
MPILLPEASIATRVLLVSDADFRSSKKNSTTSPLLTLPAEIRNKIFSYAVGGYDICIKALDMKATTESSHGISTSPQVRKQKRVTTIILPKGTDFRRARDGDDLPALALPLACRQLYTETSLLPYMLNCFALVGDFWLSVESDIKYSRSWYNTFDFWTQQRTPAQLKAITSLAAPHSSISKWLDGRRPAFCTVFPGLKYLDLRMGLYEMGDSGPQETLKERRVVKKDLGSSFEIQWPVMHGRKWTEHFEREDALEAGPSHFEVLVDLRSD